MMKSLGPMTRLWPVQIALSLPRPFENACAPDMLSGMPPNNEGTRGCIQPKS